MIQLLNLQVEGFCSIVEPMSILLNSGHVILIKGPNGNGKTTLFSALTWALYGVTLKGKVGVATWESIRPKDYCGTRVEVSWQCPKGVFKVIRCSKYIKKLDDGLKGADRLILIQDGQPSMLKSKIQIQKAIENALGLTYNIFVSSIMFGQGLTRLLQVSDSEKKRVIEEIFDLEYLNTARQIAKDERTDLSSKQFNFQHTIESKKREVQIMKESKENLKKQERDYRELYKAQKQRIKNRITELEADILAKKPNLDKDWGEILKKQDGELSNLKKDLAEVRKVEKLPLIDLIKVTLDLLKNNHVKKAIKNLEELQINFKKIETLRNQIDKLNDALSITRNHCRQQDIQANDIKNLIKELDNQYKDLENLKSKNSQRETPKIPDYTEKIAKISKEIESLNIELSKYNSQLGDYQWVLDDALSNQGIKAFLFDSSLQILNENLERYAQILGFRIEFNIDLDTARKEFVTLIEKDGIIIEYDELSGGEKGLVNLTMCLALHETLTMCQGINVLLLDEVFESLDKENIELVISLLSSLGENKTIFLVSHLENLNFRNCRILEAVKSKGLTHYNSI